MVGFGGWWWVSSRGGAGEIGERVERGEMMTPAWRVFAAKSTASGTSQHLCFSKRWIWIFVFLESKLSIKMNGVWDLAFVSIIFFSYFIKI